MVRRKLPLSRDLPQMAVADPLPGPSDSGFRKMDAPRRRDVENWLRAPTYP